MRSSARDERPGEAGFTMIELLVAITVLAAVALAAGMGFASSTRFANGSETRQGLANRAQQQVEYLASLPYDQLALAVAPTSAATPADPRYWVNAGAGTYRWDRTGAKTPEALVVDPAGAVPAAVQDWSDGTSAGKLYSFVTWVPDADCGAGCPTDGKNYKRVTVAATLESGGAEVAPVYIASIVSDAHASPAGKVSNGLSNPLTDPLLRCTDPTTGAQSECTRSAGSSNITQWYLTDSPITSAYAAPTASHAPHPTTVTPDLLSETATPASTPVQPLYDYSTGVSASGGYPGGRLLRQSVSCASPPPVDDTKAAQWVTAPLSATLALTGQGGMSLTTQTLAGVTAGATICLGLYDVGSLTNLLLGPTTLGVLSYTLSSWPTTPTPVSFTFDFVTGGTRVVAAGHRIAARLWVASGADLAVIYDHPDYASMLQLDSL